MHSQAHRLQLSRLVGERRPLRRVLHQGAGGLDLDCIVTLIGLSIECTAWGQELVYPENEAAHPNYDNQLNQDIDGYEKIKYVDYHTCDRMVMHVDTVKKLVEHFRDEVPVVAFVFGSLGTLSMMRKQEETYMEIYDEPEAVKAAAAWS